MGGYKKGLDLWRRKNITTDAELAGALNGHSIAFAYHSGKIEHDGVTAYTSDLRTLFKYKRHDYVTGREEAGAVPEDVADEMRELLEELQEVASENVLTAAAYFHSKFENIHPSQTAMGGQGCRFPM